MVKIINHHNHFSAVVYNDAKPAPIKSSSQYVSEYPLLPGPAHTRKALLHESVQAWVDGEVERRAANKSQRSFEPKKKVRFDKISLG